MSIVLKNIYKSFSKKVILNDVSLEILPGQCYCLLGKNGAGKSTIINLLADLRIPDSGEIHIWGMNYQTNTQRIKSIIGIMPEYRPVLPELTGFQYLKFTALLYSLEPDEIEGRIMSLYNYFFEEDALHKQISSYSTGMKAKISICSAIIHKPRILILDEPFSGLDTISSNSLISFLKSFSNSERIILISSHDLSHVEQIATHIGVLDDHILKCSSTFDEFTQKGKSILEDRLLELFNTTSKEKDQLSWLL